MRRETKCPPASGGRAGQTNHRGSGDLPRAGMRSMFEKGRKALSAALALVLLLSALGGWTGQNACAENAAPEASAEETAAETGAYSAAKRTSLTAVDDSFADDKWKQILNQPALFHRMISSFPDAVQDKPSAG